MAGFERLPSGNWRYVVYHPRTRRKIRRGGYPTRRAAAAAAAQLEADLANPVIVEPAATGDPHQTRLDDVLTGAMHASHHRPTDRASLSPTTLAERERIVSKARADIADLLAVAVTKVDAGWVSELRDRLAAEGWSAHRQLRLWEMFTAGWKPLIRSQVVTVDPWKNDRPRKPKRRRIVVPSAIEVTRLFAAAQSGGGNIRGAQHAGSWELYLRLAAETGARRSELIAARWRHLDADPEVSPSPTGQVLRRRVGTPLRQSRLDIADSIIYAPDEHDLEGLGQGLTTRGTKTGVDGQRVVTVSADLTARLLAHRPERSRPDHFIFSADDGCVPWKPGWVTRRFAQTAKAAELDHLDLHHLRHFSATQLLAAGGSPVIVARRLGHADISTTTRLYSAWITGSDASIVEAQAARMLTAESTFTSPSPHPEPTIVFNDDDDEF